MPELEQTSMPVNNTEIGMSNPLNTSGGDIQPSLSTEQQPSGTQLESGIPATNPVEPIQQTTASEVPINTTPEVPVNSNLGTPENSFSEVATNTGTGQSILENQTMNPQPMDDSLSSSQAVINAAKKERLAQLLKAEGDKQKKVGFTKGILSGVTLMLGIFVIGILFAKEQIVNILSDDVDKSAYEGSVVSLSIDEVEPSEYISDEYIIPEDDYLLSSDEEASDKDVVADEEASDKDVVADEEASDKDVVADKEASDKDVVADKEASDKDVVADEKASDKDVVADEEASDKDVVADEEAISDTLNINNYIIKYVDSLSEANWVLPSHCTDLTCYGEDKEFSPCTEFRQNENLDENANRIGSNGMCRYKDSSELVYVEFK